MKGQVMYSWQVEKTETEEAFDAIVWEIAKRKGWDGAMAYGARWELEQARRKARFLLQTVNCDYGAALTVAQWF